jgi:glycosyltransferase involved in cell wall biosynthesis
MDEKRLGLATAGSGSPAELSTISVVVPNFNGELYLPECLDSIVAQGYPNLELIVVDGASTDRSMEIVRSYGGAVSIAVSEPDSGQSDAINKGLRRATGEVVVYLNSDDVLEPGCLFTVGQFFASHADTDWLAGGCRVFGATVETAILRPEGWSRLSDSLLPWNRPQRYVFPQSGACFMRRSLMEKLGPYDETLHYSMDMEYYARAAFAGSVMQITPEVLAGWRIQPDSKTMRRGTAYAFRSDEVRILRRYLQRLPAAEREMAAAELRSESLNTLLREANYWSRAGKRMRGAVLLARIALSSPKFAVSRPWLGGLRLALFG